MARQSSVSFRLSLVAVLFGLYGLCMTGAARGHGVQRRVTARHAHAVGSDTSSLAVGHLQHASQHHMGRAVTRSSGPTSLFKATCFATPDFAEALSIRENPLALGAAAHTPGPSRAPPAA